MEDNIILKIDVPAPDMSGVDAALKKLESVADTTSMSFEQLNEHLKEEAEAVKAVSDEVKRLAVEQAKLSRGEEAYKKITAEINRLRGALSNVSKTHVSMEAAANRVRGAYEGVADKMRSLVEAGKRAGASVVNFFRSAEARARAAETAAVGLLNAAYKVGDGLKAGLSKGAEAAKAFGKAVLATGLGALLGLIVAIGAKLAENEKVARAFGAVFGAIGKLVDPIVDLVADIVDGLMSGRETVQGWYESVGGISGLFEKLLDFLKSQFEVRLKAIAGVFEGIVNLDFKKVGSSLADAVTGVEGTVDKAVDGFKRLGEQVVDDAKKIYAAETAAAEMYKTINALSQEQSRLNQKASELNDVLSDGNISAFERLEATKELNAVNEKVLALEIAKKKEELRIEKMLADAKGMSEEAAKNISDKQTELVDLQGQYNSLVKAGAKALELMQKEMDKAADEFAFGMSEIARSTELVKAELVRDEYKKTRLQIEQTLESTLAALDKAEDDLLEVARQSARSREELEANVAKVKETLAERRRAEEAKAEKQLADLLRAERMAALDKEYAEASEKRKAQLRSGLIESYEFDRMELEASKELIEKKLELVEKGTEEELGLRQRLSDALLALRQNELETLEADMQRRQALAEYYGQKELKNAYQISREKYKIEEEYLRRLLEREDLSANERMEIERRLMENNRSALQERLGHMKEQFDAFASMATEVANNVGSLLSEMSSRAVAEEEARFAKRSESLDKAVKLGLKTQEQADRERMVAEEQMQKRIRKEQEKQAKIQKGVALFNAIITGAQAVLNAFASAAAIPVVGFTLAPIQAGIAAALAAVQIGLIASQPLPKFRKGVLALDGPGDGQSDSILARLSKGESVMTAKETELFYPTLKAIRDNQIEPSVLNEFATGGWNVLENRIIELTNELKRKEMVVINADDNGFTLYAMNNAKRWELMNKRYGA